MTLSYLIVENANRKTAIEAGMTELSRLTCIKFHEKTNADTNHIEFFKGSG